MIRLLRAEFAKLHGSLAVLIAVCAPALPGGLAALSLLTRDRPAEWAQIFDKFALPIWSLFLMPMVIAAFATLVAQIEYRARAWDHVLALPFPRWQVFAAKLAVMAIYIFAMAALLLGFTIAAAWGVGTLTGNPPQGALAWGTLARAMGLMLAAGSFLAVVQLWAALRFGNFVVPLAVGIGGTLIALAVAITGSQDAWWFPWTLPLRVMAEPDPLPAALLGAGGAVVAGILMLADLSRRRFG